MLFFYVRHADPIYAPNTLTPLGRRQAEAAAHRLAQFGLDKIYSSSSARAIETAIPTCELLKKDSPVILDWCNEAYAWNELTLTDENGKKDWLFKNEELRRFFNTEDIKALGQKWYTHERFADMGYAVGMERIQREADAFLAELGYEHLHDGSCYRVIRPNGERVALFAHQGFGLAFLSCVLDIPYPMFCSHFDIGHTGITVIEFAEKDGYSVPRVLQLSNDGHLWRDGIPTNYQNRLLF